MKGNGDNMIQRAMTVEDAVMSNSKVLEELNNLGINYDFVAMENLEVVLRENGINFDLFVKKLEDSGSYEGIEEIKTWSKEEIIKYIIREIHPFEIYLIEKLDKELRELIHNHFLENGEQLFTIYETLLLIKAELVHHFSKEEKIFEEFLEKSEVDFQSLLAEHEKTIGLFDRIEYLSHNYSLRASYEEIQELNADLHKLDNDMRRHIYIENEILFKMQ